MLDVLGDCGVNAYSTLGAAAGRSLSRWLSAPMLLSMSLPHRW
jgi:hypothetical protein